MMHKNYFLELTGQMMWVNDTLRHWIGQITGEQWEQIKVSSFSSIRQTVLHLVSAEKIWLDYWRNVPDPAFLSQEFNGDKAELLLIWRQTSLDLMQFIRQYPEDQYDKPVVFKVRGEVWTLEFWQTFAHFMNHATYHRGQLVTLLRQVGFTDLSSTDMASYFRLRQSEPGLALGKHRH